jgi:hypothetical protein
LGEAGTVKIRTDTTPKLEDRMYDPKTKRIRISRDVVWLHHMYFEKDVKLAGDPYIIDFETLETPTFHVLEEGKGTQTETVNMEIPKGFERFYASNLVLLLLTTLYGLKQAALAFWRKLVLTMKANSLNRSKADPCLYCKWDKKTGLSVVISVIDEWNLVGTKLSVLEIKQGITRLWDCDEVGETKECVGLKVEYKPAEGFMKLTQPVLIQSLADEFPVPEDGAIATPGVPGDVLEQEESDLTREEQRVYRSGVGKLMHLARWTRVESANAI